MILHAKPVSWKRKNETDIVGKTSVYCVSINRREQGQCSVLGKRHGTQQLYTFMQNIRNKQLYTQIYPLIHLLAYTQKRIDRYEHSIHQPPNVFQNFNGTIMRLLQQMFMFGNLLYSFAWWNGLRSQWWLNSIRQVAMAEGAASI